MTSRARTELTDDDEPRDDHGRQAGEPGRRAGRPRLAAVAAAIVIAGLLGWLVAPLSLRGGPATSGDADLAAKVRAAIEDDRGYQALHISEITATSVRHAGVGSIDPGGQHALTAATPVELGSITKTFNGMLLADAITRGEVAATDTLSTYLPRLAGTPIGGVTLEELASHRGAVPPFPPPTMARGLWGMITNTDQLADDQLDWVLDQTAAMPLLNGRGTVQYSNLGATLLGWALASAAHQPDWRTYVTNRLLTPLGMTHTVFAATREQIPTDAPPGRLVGGRRAFQGVSPTYQPAGSSTWTTPDDIARYAQAILRSTVPGMPALEPRFAAGPPSSPSDPRIGYHWFTLTVAGHTFQWHNGGTAGYRSMLVIDRTAGRAVFVVTNSTRPVDPLAIRLLTGAKDGPGSTRPPTPVIGLAVTTLVLVLIAGTIAAAYWATTRLQLVRATAGAVLGLSAWRIAGPWDQAPGPLWVLAAAATAATVTMGIHRVRARPWHRPRRATVSWAGALLALAAAGLTTAIGLT
jgi:CubicO group peptidase (beta-lactamase class C family)